MKFFKTSLIVEDFFSLFPEQVIGAYDKKTFKLIAEDFNLSTRISKPETIVRHIKELDNPKQYMLDKLVEVQETRRIEEVNMPIGQMSTRRIRDELKRASVESEGNPDELRERLRAHRENTLQWVAYGSEILKREVDARHINRDKRIEKRRKYSEIDNLRYREHAAELLDFYDAGELWSEDFANDEVYTTYVMGRLKAFGLSTEGTLSDKQLRLIKYVLDQREASLVGNIDQLLDRLVRFLNGKELNSDMSPELIKKRIETYGGLTVGSSEEMVQRLDRFKKKKQTANDYSDGWLRGELQKYEAPTTGNRQQLLERHRIIYLSEENARLRKELEDCHRRRHSSSYSYRRSSNKNKSSGPGFKTGLVTGVIGSWIASRRRNEQKTTLKF